TDVGVQPPRNVSLLRIWKLPVMLAHEKVKLREQKKGNFFFWVPDCSSHNKKAVRGKIAWLKSPVRHRTLAPFDGITRIRFKGSSSWTSQPLRLPRISISLRIGLARAKSTTS